MVGTDHSLTSVGMQNLAHSNTCISENEFALYFSIWDAHSCAYRSEEVGHDLCNVWFLLTQRVDLGCVGVYYSLWQTHSN